MDDASSNASSIVSDACVPGLTAFLLHDIARFESVGKGLAGSHCSITIPVSGYSMGTALPDGTVAQVDLSDGVSCLAGEVIIFRQAKRLVAHRILYRGVHGRAADYLITRGDTRIAPDPPVLYSQVLGRVTGVVASNAILPLARMRKRHWLVRCFNAVAMLVTVLALHVSPRVATHATRLLTTVERCLVSVSVLQHIRRILLATRRRQSSGRSRPSPRRLPWVQ